jgi:hypothetical protein
MRIKVQQNGVSYYPERCPLSGAGDQIYDCECTTLTEPVRCAYESTQMLHVDPPMNCPVSHAPAELIAEAVVL